MDILGFDVAVPAALEGQYQSFLINLGLWVGLAILVSFVVDKVLGKFVKGTETDVDDKLHSIIRGPVILLVVLYGFVHSFSQLDFPDSITNIMELLYNITLAVSLMWMAWKIYKDVALPIIAYGTKKKASGLERSLIPVLESVGKIGMVFIGVIVLLGFIGIDITVLIASFGLIGLVIAFAAQDTLSNLFAGIHLLLDRPFQLGDIIILEDGDYYEVKSVGMRSTRLFNTFKNTIVVFPNSEVAGGKIVNLSEPDPQYKVWISIDVAYGTNIETVKQLMLDTTVGVPNIIHEEGQMPISKIGEFKDSSIEMKMMFWVPHFDDQWGANAMVRERLLESFEKNNVEIPFPQLVVHKRVD